MAQTDAFAPPPATTGNPVPPLPVPAAVTHLMAFLSLGWSLTQASAYQAVFVDLGAELPVVTAVLMKVCSLVEATGVPFGVVALLGLLVDAGVWTSLRRKGRYRAAENWLWIVAGAVIPVSIGFQMILQLPLIKLIEAMK